MPAGPHVDPRTNARIKVAGRKAGRRSFDHASTFFIAAEQRKCFPHNLYGGRKILVDLFGGGLDILSIGAIICTVLTTLTAVVFCMAMGANASASDMRQLKLWMAGSSLLGDGGVAAAIFLLRAGQLGWAAGVAFAPTVLFGIAFLVALIK
jgi:hypothetical protein